MTPFQHFADDYRNKKVLILGLGTQGRGVGSAQVFCEIGAQVRITDSKTAEQLSSSIEELANYKVAYSLGQHLKEDILWADVIIRNASVPWNHELLLLAREKNIPIKMDAVLFFEYADISKTIGITGTRGKSTTTTLIYEILTANNCSTHLAGNITPTASLRLLQKFDPKAWYVFELSSWQLQAFHESKISPHIAVLTNLYPDHLLDRTYQEYIQDKMAIYMYQEKTDFLVANKDNSDLVKVLNSLKRSINWFSASDGASYETQLQGIHNLENIAAAVAVAKLLKLSNIASPIKHFTGLSYRLEPVGRIHGAKIINDTTSTTPIAATKALEAYPGSILILGGTSKKLPVQSLAQAINSGAKKVVLIKGSGTDELKPYLDKEKVVGEFDSLKESLKVAVSLIENADDVILFSPAFTSFGMFKNEFDRGNQFNQLIKDYE